MYHCGVSLRFVQLPPSRCSSGTVEADEAYWGLSKGTMAGPQGQQEAGISGTLDVTKMGNWPTGCL